MILVIIFGFWLNISMIEWCICLTLFGLVISLELANTAIETVVDIAMPEKNEKAKKAKDISAAAVLVSVIGQMIFIPKILVLL